jgi:hypothetical protein
MFDLFPDRSPCYSLRKVLVFQQSRHHLELNVQPAQNAHDTIQTSQQQQQQPFSDQKVSTHSIVSPHHSINPTMSSGELVENKHNPQSLHMYSPLSHLWQLHYCRSRRRNPRVGIGKAAQPALLFSPSGKRPVDSLVYELGGLGYFDVGLSVGVWAEENGGIVVSLLRCQARKWERG